MFRSFTSFSCLALTFLTAAPQPVAAEAKKPLSFIKDVAPILRESCFGCHGAKNPNGKLNMTTFATFRKGGIHDEPIEAGKPDDSLLINLLKATDNTRMPPRDKSEALPPAKIKIIEQWVKEGAKLDDGIAQDADILRELRTRWKPPAPFSVYSFPVQVTSLAFTPDGKKLVASGHYELTVWHADSGKLEKRIATRCRRALAMIFLADGKLAVAGGRPGEEGDVRIYDIDGPGKTDNGVTVLDGVNDPKVMIAKLFETDDEVQCLALSADGKRLAAGGCDRTVHVWDISGGYGKIQPEQSVENHADWVFGIAFSPDGKYLVTGGRDKTAKVWDLNAKESVMTFPDHQSTVTGVAVRHDGRTAFSTGADNALRSWSVTGPVSTKPGKPLGTHAKPILKLIAHPTQPLLATCSEDMTVKLWNADKGAVVRTLNGHTDQVFSIAFSPDATLVASGSWNGEVKVWKVSDGSVVKAFNASPGLAATPK